MCKCKCKHSHSNCYKKHDDHRHVDPCKEKKFYHKKDDWFESDFWDTSRSYDPYYYPKSVCSSCKKRRRRKHSTSF